MSDLKLIFSSEKTQTIEVTGICRDKSKMKSARVVVVLGIDCFAVKNKYQTDVMGKYGFRYKIFTTGNKQGIYSSNEVDLVVLKKSFIARLLQLGKCMWVSKKEIHHAEIYTGGRMSVFYVLLSRLFGVKAVVVERGEVLNFVENSQMNLNKALMFLTYRLSNSVWYREIYMREVLLNLGVRRLFFLPNAVPKRLNQPFNPLVESRDLDFLWVNRLTIQRHPIRFAEVLRPFVQQGARLAMLGLTLDAHDCKGDFSRKVTELLGPIEKVTLLGISEPYEWYKKAKFFVLHADLIYANFSLLEAMSFGVVPIVSDVIGTEKIVVDGENGIVVENTKAGLKIGIERALALSDVEVAKLSVAAASTIEKQFGLEQWGDRMNTYYSSLW